ncbi:MAG: flagellar hook protein FlgE [Alphaproteobacteria bacterium]
MGLFGSLYSSTSGMLAASRATQVTSTNVANMSTTGYKKSDTAFADLVNSSRYSSTIDATGGVTTEKLLRASKQGQLQQTGISLDAGITGNGFFAVQQVPDGTDNFLYTRNGQFGESPERGTNEVYLKNSSGFYLYGWPTDTDGITTASGSDVSSLQPLEVGQFTSQVLPTSRIDLGINLDASETDINPHLLGGGQTLPVNAQSAQFSRSINVYDTTGTAREVNFEFRKITGPQAQFTSNLGSPLNTNDVLVDNPAGPTSGITNGNTLSIGNSAGSLTVTFVNGPADTSLNQVNTMADLRSVINNYTDPVDNIQQFQATISDNGELQVSSINPAESLDISASSANVLGPNGFNFVDDPVDGGYTYDPFYDTTQAPSATGPYPDQGNFPALQNVPNPQGWWEVTVNIPDPANPSGTTRVPLTSGMLNFNGDGTLNTADPTLNLGTIDFDSSGTGEETAIAVNMTRSSQFSGGYNVLDATQNGAPLGDRTGITIEDNGLVMATFSNGSTVPIYRIPLATFANPDGLREESGTVFSATQDSGLASIYEAGTNGAGDIYGSTIEGSNVDISEEFGDLIVHQRSFGLNSKVINAVDEMTQTLVRLKR